ncbi:MAG: acyl-CoA ligase (AMP-forming), exosortase A system-associated [Proteobacteria bacterium]|nr:acyl-CoA ligase (AMP-forming), exosortase A system-associated [Pseudomonadota bacterium]MBU4035515.1 acyl-CoA ligase (AMP-forming), exosortase A system-associated [Pseudomonadota bacterium]
MKVTISDWLSFYGKEIPNKTALVYKGNNITYSNFNMAVDRVAALLQDSGFNKGDRVAVYMEKTPGEVFSILGINRIGGIFIDVNHLLKPPQVGHILNDSGARILITTSDRLQFLIPVLKTCKALESIMVNGDPDIYPNLDIDLIHYDYWKGEVKYESPRLVETDVASIIYTSGSTGMPKGVVISNRNLLAGAESVSNYVENSENDRILSVLPFSFDYGLNQLTTSLYVGATCVLMNYLFPNDILKTMAAESITGLGLIPPLWLQLLKKDWDNTTFPNWRYMTNTGGRLPEAAVREIRHRSPELRIYLMYGLTEAFRGTYLPPDQVDKRPGSVGKAIPNAEIWILNESGQHCKPGEEGELVQRGAHVSLGYWNDPDKTAKSFRPNSFAPKGTQFTEYVVYSGDRFKMDEEGFLYFVNRADEMIKTSGYRVSPTEVEEAIYATNLVEHSVVFGVADEILGEKIIAIASLKNPSESTLDDIKSNCSQKLAGYMVPKEIVIWDSLPLNSNGKLDRPKIKEMYLKDNVK